MTRRLSVQAERPAGLNQALEMLGRRIWWALLAFGAVLGGSTSLALSLPDLYRSTATVIVEREQVSEAFVRPSVTGELETRIQMIREQVMSRARLTELIDRFDLYPDSRKSVPLDMVVERMRRDTRLELKGVEQPLSGRNATIAFDISYLGREPHIVADVANALAGLYVQENTRIREGQAVRTAEFLRSQLQDVKKELDLHDRRTSEFRSSHSSELPQQVEANLANLDRLNTQLRLNGESQLRAIDRRERLEKELTERASAVDSAPVPSRDEQRLAKLEQELAELKGRFTDEYPDTIRLRAEVQTLEEKIARTPAPSPGSSDPTVAKPDLKQALGDLETELRSLEEEEHALRQAIAGYLLRVENAPKRQQDLQAISRDYETTKERYDALLKRYEEAQLAETLEQGRSVEQFRILDPAVPAREPAAPGRLRILIMGFILALGLAGGAVLTAENINTSFHSLEDLRAAVTVPMLVRVSLIQTAADTRRRRWRTALAAVTAAAGLIVIVAGSHYVARGNEQIVRLMERGRL